MNIVRRGLRKLFSVFEATPRSSRVTVFSGAFAASVFLIFLIAPNLVVPYSPIRLSDDLLAPPSGLHLMGTDQIGRDIFSRVVYGTRSSFLVAFVAVLLSMAIGVPLGSISAYYGGKLDRILTLPMDSLYVFPTMLTAIMVAFVLGTGALNTGIAVSIGTIPTFFRMSRSVVVSTRELMFVEAERVMGAGSMYIIFKHILPHVMPSVTVLMTMGLSRALLVGAGLGFLGLGVPAPTPEWGTDLDFGRGVLASGIWWPTFFPGLMIFLASMTFNLLGEGLNSILSPKYRIR